MNIILKKLLKDKKEKLKSHEDYEKYALAEKILERDDCFFLMTKDTAIGILKFLGYPSEEIFDFYEELTSFEEYQRVVPKQRYNIK